MSDKRLRRSTLGAVCDWWNGAFGGGRKPEQQQETPIFNTTFIGVNTTHAVITPGDLVAVTGFYPANITYARAKKLCFENKLKLSVSTTYPASGHAGVGVALTGSKGSALRLVYFKDACNSSYFADVDGATGDYVTKEGTATTDKEQAVSEIVFSTPATNGRRVAFCSMLGGGLSIEEVDDEIDGRVDGTFVRSKLRTTSGTFVSGVQFTTDNDRRYLYLSITTGSALTTLTANTQ